MKIVSTSVRTAAWCRTHRNPSAMSCPMWRASARSRRCAGSATRETSRAPSATSTAWVTNGRAIPAAKSAAPIGGPASWLTVMKPVWSREFAIARSSRGTSIGSSVWELLSAKTSAVPRRKRATSTTAIETVPVTTVVAIRTSTTARIRSTDTTIEPAVEPVGEGAGVQPEDQRWQPLQQRGQRHQEGVVGLRGDQQRTGRDRDAVAEVRDPRRGEQPPEARAQALGDDGFDEAAHKEGTLDARAAASRGLPARGIFGMRAWNVRNRARKRRLVDEGRAHAALVFDGDEAVAWCSTAPRPSCRTSTPQAVRGRARHVARPPDHLPVRGQVYRARE